MKILAIGAHPDDIEIFMYGLLAKLRDRGDNIFLAIATDGAAGGLNKGKKLADQRKKEADNGLKLLSKPYFFNFPDGELVCNTNAYKHIQNYINNINPELIITHALNDYHPDHRALSALTKSTASFKCPIIYCETLMGIGFQPNYYVDITGHFIEKKQAIFSHLSQNPDKFYEATKLMNRYRAAQCNLPEGHYAECYNTDISFPFADIRSILPSGPEIRPYYTGDKQSFL